MAFTISRSPTSASIPVGGTQDVEFTLLEDGNPVAGATLVVASSDLAVATVQAINETLVNLATAQTAELTYSSPGGTAPSGTAISRFTETANANVQHHLYFTQSLSVAVGQSYQMDFEIDVSNGRRYLRAGFFKPGGTADNFVWLDLQSNTDYNNNAGISYQITPLSGNWKRVRVTWTPSATETGVQAFITPHASEEYTGQYTGSTGTYSHIGFARINVSPVVTNANGKITARADGRADGLANITATYGSVTSDPCALTVGDGPSSGTITIAADQSTVELTNALPVDIIYTIKEDNSPLVGVAPSSVGNSDSSKVYAWAINETIFDISQWQLMRVTPGSPVGTDAVGSPIRRITEQAIDGSHCLLGNAGTAIAAGKTVVMVAYVRMKPGTARRGAWLGFKDHAGNMYKKTFDLVNNAVWGEPDLPVDAIAPRTLAGGWKRIAIYRTFQQAVAISYPEVGIVNAQGQILYLGDPTEYLDIGQVAYWVSPGVTDAEGKVPVRLLPRANGESDITLSYGGTTSSATEVTVSGVSGGSGAGGGATAINSLAEIIADITQPNDGYPAVTDVGWDWRYGPRPIGGTSLYPGRYRITIWGVISEEEDDTPDGGGVNPYSLNRATNTRVQIRNVQAWALSQAFQWRRIDDGGPLDGSNYTDLTTNENEPGNVREEADGGISVLPPIAHLSGFHFFPDRVPIDPATDLGVWGFFEVRLVVNNPNAPDDRDSARYVATPGIDQWTGHEPWNNYQTHNDIGIGRSKRVTKNWRAVNASSLSSATLTAYPPPIVTETNDPPGDLPIPENLTLVSKTSSSAIFSCDPVEGATEYHLWLADAGSGAFFHIGTYTDPSAMEITGLAPATGYDVAVSSANASDESLMSTEVSFTTKALRAKLKVKADSVTVPTTDVSVMLFRQPDNPIDILGSKVMSLATGAFTATENGAAVMTVDLVQDGLSPPLGNGMTLCAAVKKGTHGLIPVDDVEVIEADV